MKIECPNCGKAYQLPPELIARIIKEHEDHCKAKLSTQPLATDFFREVSQPSPPRTIIREWPRRASWNIAHPAKILMLAATLLWPVGIVVVTFQSYRQTVQTSVDMGDGRIVPDNGAGPVTTKGHALFGSLLAGLVCPTTIWVMVMAFLGSIWLVTRA
jgi:hypothetical protein